MKRYAEAMVSGSLERTRIKKTRFGEILKGLELGAAWRGVCEIPDHAGVNVPGHITDLEFLDPSHNLVGNQRRHEFYRGAASVFLTSAADFPDHDPFRHLRLKVHSPLP
jgi:hypothetical protein